MKKIKTFLILVLLIAGSIRMNAQTTAEIEKANKSGKIVFLVAYNEKVNDPEKAVSIANDARKKSTSSAVVIKMNTADAANNDLVTKFRIKGSALPIILVLDKNGYAAGGLYHMDATAEKLIDLIPSPKTSELIKAFTEGKSAYVVVYKESMSSKKNIIDNCYLACNKMENKSVIIKVDLEDKKEIKLIQRLNCNLTAKEPVTYVVNPSGQVIGTYNGLTDVNTLVSTAKKAPAGGCCPGGAKAGGCK
jgi:hypothetical protein